MEIDVEGSEGAKASPPPPLSESRTAKKHKRDFESAEDGVMEDSLFEEPEAALPYNSAWKGRTAASLFGSGPVLDYYSGNDEAWMRSPTGIISNIDAKMEKLSSSIK